MNDALPFEFSLAAFLDHAAELSRTNRMESAFKFAEALELTPLFQRVVQAVATLEHTEALRNRLAGEDGYALRTFFRRTGVYLSLYAGDLPSVSDVAGQLKWLLLQSDVKMTYLVPIELIQLSTDQLDFEQFSIRRFKKDELAELTQNHIREAFYPWATLDLNFLEDYWFLVTTDTTPVQPSFDLGNLFDSRVRPSYTSHPQAVEKGLYPLVLYEWVDMFRPSNTAGGAIKREEDDQSFYPQLPFVIAISANWLKIPEPAPETKTMVRNTHYDDDGEEVGDSPEVIFYFDELRTKQLEEDLREFEARLRLIDKYQPEWRFVYTALGFLTKAFQTRELEQLLWHITAIEAVLGQNREGLTKILNRRIVEVFGRSPDGKKRLKKQFDDLYGFRSDLVHGNTKLDDRKIMKVTLPSRVILHEGLLRGPQVFWRVSHETTRLEVKGFRPETIYCCFLIWRRLRVLLSPHFFRSCLLSSPP